MNQQARNLRGGWCLCIDGSLGLKYSSSPFLYEAGPDGVVLPREHVLWDQEFCVLQIVKSTAQLPKHRKQKSLLFLKTWIEECWETPFSRLHFQKSQPWGEQGNPWANQSQGSRKADSGSWGLMGQLGTSLVTRSCTDAKPDQRDPVP